MRISRHGALAVVEEERKPSWVTRELRAIDDRLFIEKQLTYSGEEVWCVVCDVGLNQPPITILEWRDEDGRPIPELTSGLLSRVERMERDGARLTSKVIKQNRDLIEAGRRKGQDSYAAIVEDMLPRMGSGSSAVLHRGVHLKRSRDKQRRMGYKV